MQIESLIEKYFIMRLPKNFNDKSKDDKIAYFLHKYSCTEIASFLVEYLEKPVPARAPKIRITQEELETHFHIIKPHSNKSGKE